MTDDALTRAKAAREEWREFRKTGVASYPDKVLDDLIALAESQAQKLAAIRELAELWSGQMRMCDEAKGQQIDDGDRILAILDWKKNGQWVHLEIRGNLLSVYRCRRYVG